MIQFEHIAYRSPKRKSNCQEIQLQGIREPRCQEPECEKLFLLATHSRLVSVKHAGQRNRSTLFSFGKPDTVQNFLNFLRTRHGNRNTINIVFDKQIKLILGDFN